MALVTGAGSATGIGAACARALGREGAAVAVTSTSDRIHERRDELAAAGVDAASFIADLTDRAQATAMVDAVLDRFGRIDIVVNNAGMLHVGIPDVRVPQLPRHRRGHLGPGDRDEPQHRVQRDAPRRPGDGRAGLGTHRHGVVGDRARRHEPRLDRLRRRQGRDGGVDARARARAGSARCHRERGRARMDRVRLTDAGGSRPQGAPPRSDGRARRRRSPRWWRSWPRIERATSPASRSSSTAATRSRR